MTYKVIIEMLQLERPFSRFSLWLQIAVVTPGVAAGSVVGSVAEEAS